MDESKVCDHKSADVHIGYPHSIEAGGRTIKCGTCGEHIFGNRTWLSGTIAADVARREGYPVPEWWFDE